MFAIVIAIGLWAAERTGLGLPILEAALASRPVRNRINAILLPSLAAGIIASLLIIAMDAFIFRPLLDDALGNSAANLTRPATHPAAWKGLLASFYGGINEEVLLRLALLTFLAWLGNVLTKAPRGTCTPIVFWAANIIAAILFGLGHLPALSVYP